MSAEDRFKEVCLTDATLVGILTGGIYTFSELGERGLSPDNPVCAQAFVTEYNMPRLRPCMVIRERVDTANYSRHDADTQQTSYDGNVSFWLYQQSAYQIIDNAVNRLYGLFNTRTYSGLGLVRNIQNVLHLVAPEFNNTSLNRCDYQFKRIKRT